MNMLIIIYKIGKLKRSRNEPYADDSDEDADDADEGLWLGECCIIYVLNHLNILYMRKIFLQII
jgi:hypothetical protein